MTIIYDKSYPAGTRYPTEDQAYRALACDILREVTEDINRGVPDTLEYVERHWAFVHWCDYLGIDANAARQSLRMQYGLDLEKELSPARFNSGRRRTLTPEQVIEMHQVYRTECKSVKEVAKRYGVKEATLDMYFRRMGLTANKPKSRLVKETDHDSITV